MAATAAAHRQPFVMHTDRQRLLVTGSRDYNDRSKVERALAVFRPFAPVLVHGRAPGLDALAASIWTGWGGEVHAVPAQWERYGNRAGSVRNQQMVDLGGYVACVAFPLDQSIGTWDCMRRADKAGILVLEVK